ncbi:hypothetical protein T492DRAFT_1000926 [Pavlovales sp. CCMP2436]|nr:hypothetical protein T492DRAFT_1000926 [Pavlovales sp. CCMP2436]
MLLQRREGRHLLDVLAVPVCRALRLQRRRRLGGARAKRRLPRHQAGQDGRASAPARARPNRHHRAQCDHRHHARPRGAGGRPVLLLARAAPQGLLHQRDRSLHRRLVVGDDPAHRHVFHVLHPRDPSRPARRIRRYPRDHLPPQLDPVPADFQADGDLPVGEQQGQRGRPAAGRSRKPAPGDLRYRGDRLSGHHVPRRRGGALRDRDWLDPHEPRRNHRVQRHDPARGPRREEGDQSGDQGDRHRRASRLSGCPSFIYSQSLYVRSAVACWTHPLAP